MPILKLMAVACNYPIYGQVPLPVLDKACELGLPVNIHSGARLSTPAQIALVAARYPDVPIIMEHMGYRDGTDEAIEVAKVFSNVHLGTNTVCRTSATQASYPGTRPRASVFCLKWAWCAHGFRGGVDSSAQPRRGS